MNNDNDDNDNDNDNDQEENGDNHGEKGGTRFRRFGRGLAPRRKTTATTTTTHWSTPWHVPPHWLNWTDPSNTTSAATTTTTTTTTSVNPYRNSKTFTIVRNPYDRIISEFYCKYFGFHRYQYEHDRRFSKGNANSMKQLNDNTRRSEENDAHVSMSQAKKERGAAILKKRLETRCERDTLDWERRHGGGSRGTVTANSNRIMRPEETVDSTLVNTAIPSCRNLVLQTRVGARDKHPNSQVEREMVDRDRRKLRRRQRKETQGSFNAWIRSMLRKRSFQTGHLLPQHHYVYNVDGKQLVDHVIRFENLTFEFDELMRLYGLNVTLSQNAKVNQGHRSDEGFRFSFKDMTQKTLDLINEVYQKDFELLGYPMINTSLVVEDEAAAASETIDDEEMLSEDEGGALE